MSDETLFAGRGDRRDIVLGTAVEGWKGLEVVRFRATEALGEPFSFEITCARTREDGALDPAAFLDQPATLRVATEKRWRSIHGVVVSAEEIDRTRNLYLYRFTIAPASYRMTQRLRYRTYVDTTLREVLVSLLENRSTAHPNGYGGIAARSDAPAPSLAAPTFDSYEPPAFEYRFAVHEADRLDDAELRQYVVQFGESDHDLFHRLLEEEGLTYFFEHGADTSVLTIVDNPGKVSPFSREDRRALRPDSSGTDVSDRETVRSLRRADKLLWGGTTARDWDPTRSKNALQGVALDDVAGDNGSARAVDPDLFVHDTFPSRDADIGEPCVVPATLAVERRASARSRRVGRSSVRTLEPGLKLTLSDDSGVYDDQAIVVLTVTTYATQRLPENTALDDERWGLSNRAHEPGTYENEFIALPDDIRFRPELKTPRPRIHGIQTAVVSAEEMGDPPPEIHINELSHVRLRFPWDERVEPRRPSSCWVRVSQGWAGAGYGDVFVPRVGQEVLVAYLGGDPERPMVVGRVYNATNPVPYTKPTISTLKSKSSPDSEGYNELRFDDEAGKEEVYLQAEKNLNELVKSSHSTSVGGDQSNSVGGNQSNSVKGDRDHTVGGSENVCITGMLTSKIGACEERTVIANRTTYVGATDQLTVQGARVTVVCAAEKRSVLGEDRVVVGSTRRVGVGGIHRMHSDTMNALDGPVFHAQGGSATVTAIDGSVVIDNGAGANITLCGNAVLINAAFVSINGKSYIKIESDGIVNGTGSPILLNG